MDIEAQKAETEEIFARLSRRYVLPDEVALGLQFVPLDGPGDLDGFTQAAAALGYEGIWFAEDDAEDEVDGYLELERVISPAVSYTHLDVYKRQGETK